MSNQMVNILMLGGVGFILYMTYNHFANGGTWDNLLPPGMIPPGFAFGGTNVVPVDDPVTASMPTAVAAARTPATSSVRAPAAKCPNFANFNLRLLNIGQIVTTCGKYYMVSTAKTFIPYACSSSKCCSNGKCYTKGTCCDVRRTSTGLCDYSATRCPNGNYPRAPVPLSAARTPTRTTTTTAVAPARASTTTTRTRTTTTATAPISASRIITNVTSAVRSVFTPTHTTTTVAPSRTTTTTTGTRTR